MPRQNGSEQPKPLTVLTQRHRQARCVDADADGSLGIRHQNNPQPRHPREECVMTYRACPTKRSRRTKAGVTAIRDAIVDVIGEDPPMTVRQVFYQLVTRGVIEKTEAQYQGTVIRLMTEMRLSGELRFDWVVMKAATFGLQRPTTASPTPLNKPPSSTVAARSRSRPIIPQLVREGRTRWSSCGTSRRTTTSRS